MKEASYTTLEVVLEASFQFMMVLYAGELAFLGQITLT